MENNKFEEDLEVLRTHSGYAYKYAKNKMNYSVGEKIWDESKQLLSVFGWYEKYGAEPEDAFHPVDAGCIKLDDNYFFGIRCEHLIWIDYYDVYGHKTLLIGNHKGSTHFRVITYNEESYDNKKCNE